MPEIIFRREWCTPIRLHLLTWSRAPYPQHAYWQPNMAKPYPMTIKLNLPSKVWSLSRTSRRYIDIQHTAYGIMCAIVSPSIELYGNLNDWPIGIGLTNVEIMGKSKCVVLGLDPIAVCGRDLPYMANAFNGLCDSHSVRLLSCVGTPVHISWIHRRKIGMGASFCLR